MARESTLVRWLWLPVNFVQGVFTAAWSAFWIAVALVLTAFGRCHRPALWIGRWVWAPGLVYGAGARLVVTGAARVDFSRPHLFVANHGSWIDIPVLMMALPVELRFLAKRELARVPLLGWYARAMGMVFVDRSDARRATASVGRATDLLARGASVVSFPEGTRSRDGRLASFKSGGFGAALEAGVDVVPVALVGARDVLPADGFRVRPGRIEVRVGEPIPAAAGGQRDRGALARRAEEAVARLLAATARRD